MERLQAIAGILSHLIIVAAQAQPIQRFSEISTLDAPPGSVLQLACGAGDVLALRTTEAILIVRPGDEPSAHLPADGFTDMDFSPDGTVLYAADWSGESDRYEGRGCEHSIHRYDVATGQWAVARLPIDAKELAYGIEAVSASRFVIHGAIEECSMDLMEWGNPPRLVLTLGGVMRPRVLYDARRRWLWFTGDSTNLNAMFIGDRYRSSGALASAYCTVPEPMVLATDASYLYLGARQVDLSREIHGPKAGSNFRPLVALVFPEPIHAATERFAFGENSYYSPSTRQPLGSLGIRSQLLAASGDGTRLWVCDQDAGKLREFDLGSADHEGPDGTTARSAHDLLDRYFESVATGHVDRVVTTDYDAATAAHLAYGTDFDRLGPAEREVVEEAFRLMLRDQILDPELRRMHAEGAVLEGGPNSNDTECSIGYHLEIPSTGEHYQAILSARCDPATGRWWLTNVAFGRTRSFLDQVKQAQRQSGLPFLIWARKVVASGGPSPPNVALQSARELPTDPADVAEFFRAGLADVEALLPWFSVRDSAAQLFGGAWTALSDGDREYVALCLAERLRIEIETAEVPEGEIAGASAQSSGDQRVIRYAFKRANGGLISERIMLVRSTDGLRFVDATINGKWLLRPIEEAFAPTGVSLLRFASFAMAAPEPPFEPNDGPLMPVDVHDPIALVSEFVRRIAMGRVDEAFRDCVDAEEMLGRAVGRDSLATLSAPELVRARSALSHILFRHHDAYDISELRRKEFSPAELIDGTVYEAIVRTRLTDAREGAEQQLRWVLSRSGGEWRIVDFQVEDENGEWRPGSNAIAERRRRAGGGSLLEDLEAMSGK